MCEIMVEAGHNTKDLDPYLYSLRKLYTLFELRMKIDRERLLASTMTQHMSRVACATGDAKDLIKLIEDMQE